MNVPEVRGEGGWAEYLLECESASLLTYEEENTRTATDCCLKYPDCTVPQLQPKGRVQLGILVSFSG